jgi:hypothetical protein
MATEVRRRTTAGVIIPAHNEGALIRQCVSSILAQAGEGMFQVVVVSNGCTDDTAEQARLAGPDVEVVESSIASKAAALNLGDSVLGPDAFPRCYVDGDVTVTPGTVRAVAQALGDGITLLAFPQHRFDLTGCSWLVRRFHGAWVRTPFWASHYMSTGFYAMSREGRARFERFPSLIADDMFVHSLFAPEEKRCVGGATVVQRLPRTIREIVKVQVRHETGNRELRECPEGPSSRIAQPPHARLRWLVQSLKQPGNLADLAVFASVKALAKPLAWWQCRHGHLGWIRDESTRHEEALQ